MERGEVDIVGAYGLPGMLVSQPNWVHKKEANILYAASLKRHRLLAHVPTLPELALTGRQDDGMMRFTCRSSPRKRGPSSNKAQSGFPLSRE